MTTTKDLWLGRSATDFAQHLVPTFINMVDEGWLDDKAILQANDMYLSGFAYAVSFDNDYNRYLDAIIALYNQIRNPLGFEGVSDLLNVLIVDNQNEKDVFIEIVTPVVEKYFNNRLAQKVPLYTSLQQINSSGLGIAIITLDELPAFLTKYDELVKRRLKGINKVLTWANQVLESHQSKDFILNDKNLSQEELKRFLEIFAESECTLLLEREKLDQVAKDGISLYQLYSHLQSVHDFLTQSNVNYEVKHTRFERNESGNDIEIGEDIYQYSTAALGLVYIANGYLYNKPNYYKQRAHLLNFIRSLRPNYLVWCEEPRQEQRLQLESLTHLTVRRACNIVFHSTDTYALELTSIQGNNERINFNLLAQYQDLRSFRIGNGYSSGPQNTLRLTPGKHIARLKNADSQLLTALTLGVLQRLVLVVTANREETIAQIESYCEQVPELRAAAKQLAIINQEDVQFYRSHVEVAVILKEVKVTRNLLADLYCSVYMPPDQFSATIIYGVANSSKGTVKGKKRKGENGEEGIELQDSDLIDEQRNVIIDFLRDRRFVRRNNIPNDPNYYYQPVLSQLDTQFAEYFDHQEKRNWHSQLSSDKFLTVRFNNREISYYPNLNGNLYVLAGINRNFFSRPFASDYYNQLKTVTQPSDLINEFTFNQNLNSGDLITNISIAIHRLINLFTERDKRVGCFRNVAAYWIVSDSQAELLPLYAKLFTNIFNKEPNVKVDIKLLSDAINTPIAENSVLNINTNSYVKMTDRKLAYNFILYFAQLLIQEGSNLDVFANTLQQLNELKNHDINQFLAVFEHTLEEYSDNYNIIFEDPSFASMLHTTLDYFAMYNGYEGANEIVLMTVSEYQKYCRDTAPDVIVVENSFDLYQESTAANFANFIRELLILSGVSIILVSSPDTTSEKLLYHAEFRFKRLDNSVIALDVPTCERYAFGIHVAKNDFLAPEYKNFKASDYDYDAVINYIKNETNARYKIAVRAFDLPLTPYALPQYSNQEYRIVERQQLPPERRFGYIPALGEKLVDIYVDYLPITPSVVINKAISVLLQAKNSKSRGLLVVQNPELKAFCENLAGEFGIVVHDFKSVALERAIFSHAVIIADNNDYLQHAVLQHVTLITRGFRFPGNIFMFANMDQQSDVLGIIAADRPNTFCGHHFELYPELSQVSEKESRGNFRRDNISPYFSVERQGETVVYRSNPRLPGARNYSESTKGKVDISSPLSEMFEMGLAGTNFTHGSGKRKAKHGKRRK